MLALRRLIAFRALSTAVAALALTACGDDDPAGPEAPDGPSVRATSANVFTPGTITVDIGDAVTWVFGSVDHNVMFAQITGAPSDIGNTRNANVARTFAVAGTFPYMCSLHIGMAGTVVVE